MFENEKIKKILDQAITFLASQQENKGNFLSLSFTAGEITESKRYHSLFFTTLILDILAAIPEDPRVKSIKRKSASFILSQKSIHWSFNYWERASNEEKNMPYPDDLDDTFCALASLFHYNSKLIDGEAMAKIVQLLTAVEVKEGGPYRTWLVPEKSNKKWKDIDLAVNSNIAYFLSLHGINLPQLTLYVEKYIKKEIFVSPYYPSEYQIIYFISRFYKGNYCERLQKFILAKRDKKYTWGNPLQTALAVSSLLNLGIEPDQVSKSIAFLIESRQEDLWQPFAFCIDPTIGGKTFYAGSSALTTAFCLEAIIKYQQALEHKLAEGSISQEERLYKKIISGVENVFSIFEKQNRVRAISLVHILLDRKEGRQIPLLSYYFAETLGGKKEDISEDLLVQLGMASVLGWVAYTIYDDFLDDEGDPAMLSIANVAHRELTLIFESIFSENNEFRTFFHTIMGRLDEANAWEVTHCRAKVVEGAFVGKHLRIPRYGKYERLAYKSLGHGLGPIAVLFSLGYTWNSPEVRYVVQFFENYLIAKQLSDDAHDWENDLKKGHINPIVAKLLKRVYSSQIEERKDITIDDLLPHLQLLFWQEVIDEVCVLLFAHTKRARRILKVCPMIVNPGYLEQILVVYENVAQRVLHERKQALEFIEAYST